MILGLGNTIPSDSVRQGLGGGGGGSFDNTYSLAFDGVDDKLTVAQSTYSGAFTFSFWAKPEIHSTFVFGLSTGSSYLIWLTSATSIRIRLRTVGGTYSDVIFTESGGNNIVLDEFQQIIITRDSSNNLNCYRNGTAFGSSGNNNKDFIFDSIGGGINFNTWDFKGNLDEVAVWNSDQSSNIGSIYSSSGAVDLASLNPTLWLRNGDNGSYKSPQWLIPNNSNKDKVSNYSYLFDGVDDFINCGNDNSLNFGSALTVSAWVKPTNSLNQVIASKNNSSTDGFVLMLSSGVPTKARFFIYIGGALKDLQGTTTITHDVWSHVLAVNDGTDLKLYVNGVLDNTLTGGGGAIDSNTHNFVIGARADGTLPFDNFMDEVAVWNSDQSANVASIYNSGTPSAITGAVAHWKMGEEANFTDNWLVNNSALSNYSTRSFNFDGVDDYIDFGNPASLQITTDLSVSFWFKGSSTADQAIVAKDSLGLRCWGIWNNVFGAGNNLQFYIFNSNSLTEVQTSANYNDGNWHNVVCVFKPSTYLRIYVDGVLDGENTTSIPATIDNDAANLTVGAIVSSGSPIYEFEGNVDEVAIWNSDQSSNVSSIYSSGTPSAITGAVSHWRMGEDATFSTNWSLPDNGSASNTGTSANMTIADLEGDAPNYTGGGLSNNMTIEDRVGDAPNSTSNALSYNMTESDREEDTPPS